MIEVVALIDLYNRNITTKNDHIYIYIWCNILKINQFVTLALMDRSYDEKEGPTLLQLLRSPRLYVSVSVIEQAGWRERERVGI